ncbi:MAG: putative peptidoglycan glycosyltransferase FtsW [Gammaproteobacteria bacterium]|nr:putative peptidoglycan glycosyltransferase FtsW [Gammaproteobacteria bacterium]
MARIDTVATCVWMLLLALGLVAVTSATQHLASSQINPLVLKHVFYMVVAVAVFIGIVQVPMDVVQRLHKIFYLLTLALAILVLIPGIGLEAGGGRRWIDLKFATLQVSELARLFIPIYLAGHLAHNRQAISKGTWGPVKPVLLVGVVLGLIFLQPDFGSVVLIGLVTAGMLFVAGARLRVLAAIGILAVPVFAYFLYERRNRLMAYLDTWSHAQDEGYQLSQSLIAFGRGELTGIGLGDGIQKVLYLPTPHNDFIFSVIAEEVGFVGSAVLLLVLLGLVARCLWVGKCALNAGRDFAGFLSYGAGLMLGLQTLIHVGVAIGALPTKGLTLPFISYGGNSLLVSSALVALSCRAHMELTPKEYRKGRKS